MHQQGQIYYTFSLSHTVHSILLYLVDGLGGLDERADGLRVLKRLFQLGKLGRLAAVRVLFTQ